MDQGRKVNMPLIGEWQLNWRNVLLFVAGLATIAIIATVVVSTVVLGGGGLLLLFSPLLLLFSPILIPTVIIGTLLGGAAFLVFGFVASIVAIGWLGQYALRRAGQTTDYAQQKVGQVTGVKQQ